MIYFIINLSIGIACAIALFIYEKVSKKPCDSCAHLIEKGGYWKYSCDIERPFSRHFGKAPSYCKDYKDKDQKEGCIK